LRIFLAGATGAIGRALVPQLVGSGYEVVALTRSREKVGALEALGAKVVIADALHAEALTAAITRTEPEAVIHQLTALAGVRSFRNFDREFAATNRLRTEVTDTLLSAALLVGARRFIAQSFCGWPFAREGGAVKSEDDPFDLKPPKRFSNTLAAIRTLEDAVRDVVGIDARALRYGMLYGPGTGLARDGTIVKAVRKRKFPLVGDAAGVWSFIHVNDAARATVACLSRGAPGIYNIVDDDPAPVSDWLPYLAHALGARPPRNIPTWLARLSIGEGGVSMMTTVRGGSNAKAKRELGWQPVFESWRRGFVEGLG
jgi:nucleoside-diphosphate-sugar epimerase